MKIAISIDRELLEEADRAAKQMGLSRSRLFSLAVQEDLRKRPQKQTFEALDRAYANEPDPAELRLVSRMKAAVRTTIKDKW